MGLKYYKYYNGEPEEKIEITYEEALHTILGTYRDNDMTRDMLTVVNRIRCQYSTVTVEEETKYGMNMTIMAGLCNMTPEEAVYDDNGKRIR